MERLITNAAGEHLKYAPCAEWPLGCWTRIAEHAMIFPSFMEAKKTLDASGLAASVSTFPAYANYVRYY